MQNLTKRFGIAVLATGLAVAATIASAKEIKLAVMPAGMDTFGSAVARGFTEEAKTLGFTPVVIDSQWSPEKQANAIDDLMIQGINGVGLLPIDSIASMGWVDKLVAAKIPVVAGGSLIGNPAKVGQTYVYPGLAAFVNVDEIATAGIVGAMVAKSLPSDGSAKIAIVEGAPGYAVNDYRKQGFLGALDKSGVKYTVVADQPTDWSVEKGEAVCQNILTATPNVNVIFTTADPMAVGCAKAAASMKAKAAVVATAGGMKIGNDAITAGTMLASTCYKPETMGRMIAKALFEEVTKPGAHKSEFIAYDPPLVTKGTLASCAAEW